ncbi:MAG TPA: protein-glutamate O-methyltransferase CheR [Blastocatellia bacterium]|jgi:chemotaxis protein methyltransferase CheR
MSEYRSDMPYLSGANRGWVSTLSESEFRLFRDLIYEECGVSLGAEKRTFLESRLKKRMDEFGIRTAYEYYSLIRQPGKSQELSSLLDMLMICETSFFRNQPQFDLFQKTVLPSILQRKGKTGARSIRVWSAGCSTGQEPYTIVMSLLEGIADLDQWPVRVFASDLSFTALERAQLGMYRPEQMKGVSAEIIRKYFREEGGNYFISDRVKRHVVFDYHNLKHDNGLRGLDVIWCRNVMIYFDLDEQRRLINRFTNCLVPGGHLFIGHAESLQALSNRFTMIHKNKGIAYKLEE